MDELIHMYVGEVREVNGVLVECVKDKRPNTIYCGICALRRYDRCYKMCCCPTDRYDGYHVHFRRVES